MNINPFWYVIPSLIMVDSEIARIQTQTDLALEELNEKIESHEHTKESVMVRNNFREYYKEYFEQQY